MIAVFTLISNFASIGWVLIAGKLAIDGKEGWGWFLFLAVILTQSVKAKFGDKKKKDDSK